MFQEQEDPQHTKAGIIENIFQYSYTCEDSQDIEETFMVVEELTPITSFVDPYLQFGEFAGFLCKKKRGRKPLSDSNAPGCVPFRLYQDDR